MRTEPPTQLGVAMTFPCDDQGVNPPGEPGAFLPGAANRDWLADPRYRAYHAVALLAIPLLQLAANPNLFVNPGGDLIDPWVYTGFFLSLPAHLQRFGDTYYASRLSWLVPGFAAHQLFPPLMAQYALHLTFLYALLVATYGLVARGANRGAAMLVALIVACQPAILRAIGWDYVDGAGIVFLVATLLCLERAHGDRRTVMWAIAAGMAAACLIVTNLALVTLLPACGAFFLCRTGWRWRSIALPVAAAALGAAAMLGGFSLFSWGLGGRWLFLEPSVRFSLEFYGAPNRYKADGFVWVSRATWLALPMFASIGAVVSLMVPARGRSPFGRAIQATFLVALATWVLSDLVAQSAFLQYSYYTSYLAPLALIALPLQAATPPPERRLRAAVVLELLTLTTLAVASFVFVLDGGELVDRGLTWLGWTRLSEQRVVMTLAATVAGCVGVLSLRLVRSPRLGWAIFVAGLACSYIGLPLQWPPPGTDPRADFEETARAHRFIGSHVDGRPLRFWYSTAAPSSPPFRPISSSYLWGFVLINEELPALTRSQAATLQPVSRLVLLVERPAEVAAARAALREFGFDYTVVAEGRFGRGSRTFGVVIGDLVRRRVAAGEG